jgi:hypothetical protein
LLTIALHDRRCCRPQRSVSPRYSRFFGSLVLLGLTLPGGEALANTVWLELRRAAASPVVVAVVSFEGPNVFATDSDYFLDDVASFGFDFGEGLVEFDSIDLLTSGTFAFGPFSGARAEYGSLSFLATESYSAPGNTPRQWEMTTYEEPYPGQADPFYFRLRDHLTLQNEPVADPAAGDRFWFRTPVAPTFIPIPEASTGALTILGLLGLAGYRRAGLDG